MPLNIKFLIVVGFAALFLTTPEPSDAMLCDLYRGQSNLGTLQDDKKLYLQRIESAPEDVQSYCKLSHIHYKIAGQVQEQMQETEYIKCIDYADAAIRRYPRAGTAYFMKALCLGKRGELNGIWSSLQMLDDFEANMKRAVELTPELDGGGPHRALGRYYFQLPGLLGGNLDRAIKSLEKAISYGPEHWENLFYLGEAYFEDDRYHQARPLLARFLEVTRARAQEPKIMASRKQAQKLIQEIQEETGSP